MYKDRVAEVASRYEGIAGRIERAATASGQSFDKIKLLVVTKAQPVEVVEAAILAGAKNLGENYPDESVDKISALRPLYPNVDWHMIGHLQSRKSRLVVDHFNWLHSLDSLSLAEKLERILAEENRTLPVLLEFNVGQEESKFGWTAWNEHQWDELIPQISPIFNLPHLKIHGLMTMPPFEEDPEASRIYFIRLRKLLEFFQKHFPQASWTELSMGTSSDFEVAVSEGATMVRIGQAIVGPRPPKAVQP
jgi:PLP dependent protein